MRKLNSSVSNYTFVFVVNINNKICLIYIYCKFGIHFFNIMDH